MVITDESALEKRKALSRRCTQENAHDAVLKGGKPMMYREKNRHHLAAFLTGIFSGEAEFQASVATGGALTGSGRLSEQQPPSAHGSAVQACPQCPGFL